MIGKEKIENFNVSNPSMDTAIIQTEESRIKRNTDWINAINSCCQLRIPILKLVMNLCNIWDNIDQEVRGGHDDRSPLASLQGYHPVLTEVGSFSTSCHVPLIATSNLFGTLPVKLAQFLKIHVFISTLLPDPRAVAVVVWV